MVKVAAAVFRAFMSFIYFFLKKLPTNENKVLFCSRQQDSIPLDFRMIQERLKEKDANIEVISICGRINRGLSSYAAFFAKLMKSMYHLATCKVCVLDSYWPAVSMLKHKDDLSVIQIWHSIGKMKSSGYQTLDKRSGRRSEYAGVLRMHKNYDYVIGGAEIWDDYYCQAFGIEKEKIKNWGLPRMDHLLANKDRARERFLAENPELMDKKTVLYAPTFRRNMKSEGHEIGTACIYDDIAVIVKPHPSQTKGRPYEGRNIWSFDQMSTIDLLCACDFLITDYSSIALEAAVIEKKTYFWLYDYDEYMKNSGVNIDLKKEAGANADSDISVILKKIHEGEYDEEVQKRYIGKYLLKGPVCPTERITDLILSLCREQQKRCG